MEIASYFQVDYCSGTNVAKLDKSKDYLRFWISCVEIRIGYFPRTRLFKEEFSFLNITGMFKNCQKLYLLS
jgi:hypothetical protein